MDPQAFIKLSVGCLGLRVPVTASDIERSVDFESSPPCSCEIRLRGFPVKTVSVPLLSLADASPDPYSNATIFYLEESNVKELLAPRCFQDPQAYLEIMVYMGRQGSSCGANSKKQQIGTFRVEVGPEWGEGKPAVLHSGWINIGKNRQESGKPGPELHLIVKLDPDPRYVFQFEDKISLSPQIFQIQGTVKQPIFSCKFSRDRRAHQPDLIQSYLSNSYGVDEDPDRERKGWKLMIHDLSGAAIASAFMATPFVPSTGCDTVARSNPGAWLILRPGCMGAFERSWLPWGRLEAWRENRDFVYLRLHLLPEGQGAEVLLSEVMINTEKGGEFFIDMDRQMPLGSQEGIMDDKSTTIPTGGSMIGGFVMNCKVQGEGKVSRPLVQLAMGHVMCVEDAAIFIALAAAVELSIEACRPFRRKAKRGIIHSFLS